MSWRINIKGSDVIMENLDKHIESTKAKFTEIDKNIKELDARRIELTEQIDSKGDDTSLKTIQETAALRVELDLITKGLSKANSKREKIIGELKDKAWWEVTNIAIKDLAAEKKKHEHLQEKLLTAIDSLRSAYANIRAEEKKAEAILRGKLGELSVFYPVHGIVVAANFMPSREAMNLAEAIRYNNLFSVLKDDYRDETITT